MSDKIGPRCANGSVLSTGSAIQVVCGFRPAMVMLLNVTGEVELQWNRSMAAGYGFKRLGVSSGTNANESTHTHAAGAITITPHADSAGTPAGTNAASAVAASLNVATGSLTGTGYATVGQVITTTENFTADANAYAGMWFMSDVLVSSPAVMILSHPAAAGAPLVFTCNGVPPVTDAGAFRVVSSVGTAAAQAFTGAALGTHSHASTAAGATSGAGAAHTHTFTGAAAEAALVTTGGISSKPDGFSIGTDANVNPAGGNTIYWMAWRF